MSKLFLTASALTFLLGVVWLFAPQLMLSLSSNAVEESTVYMARRYGALFFGYAVMLWLARNNRNPELLRPILAGGFTVSLVISFVSLYGAVTGVVGSVIWSVFVVEMLLAVGFGYYLFGKKKP